MQTKFRRTIHRWGSSLAITIPKAIAKKGRLKLNDNVVVEMKKEVTLKDFIVRKRT
ncbi:AbrB/MazE/SpoVT family DNA-binding domain-containing protein [Candidatus Woesearchaeota archaeon]|nr:AbrB/MazE/SpoVT family DNA-binding domain-containing protein [Candidatus Woesearchaeota archaeon]